MKALVIVDPQNDFCEGGNLAVAGGNSVCEKIADELIGSYGAYIITQDWHPANHCSFDINGGRWPAHCIANTEGADINKAIKRAMMDRHVCYFSFLKGCDAVEEEYGAEFSENYFRSKNIDSVDIVGIAFDYCVKETAKTIKLFNPEMEVKIIESYTAMINPENAVAEEMKKFRIEVEKC